MWDDIHFWKDVDEIADKQRSKVENLAKYVHLLACVAGPQFYGGPDLQPAKILPAANQAPHKIEGLPRRLSICRR
jgi:hypothetical protein